LALSVQCSSILLIAVQHAQPAGCN
jgi:hypothetical protein